MGRGAMLADIVAIIGKKIETFPRLYAELGSILIESVGGLALRCS